jgi:hypothetical protein
VKASLTLTSENEEDLPAFAALIAQLRNDWEIPNDGPSAEIDEAIDVPYGGTWDRKALDALHDRCYPHHRAIVTRIAKASLNSDGATFNELIEVVRPFVQDPTARSSYGFANLRADLAWISRYSNMVNGTVWPVTKHGQSGANVYRMPKQIAEWWLDIAGSAA